MRAFVRYAREIDAIVCAEGVETAGELARLADLDVAFVQGYLVARPAAPWPPLEPAAATASEATFRAVFGAAGSAVDRDDPDDRLRRLARDLARARTAEELDACLRPVADEIGADEVRIVARPPAVAAEVQAGDPHADPAQVAALLDGGYRSKLTLPIGDTGIRIEAYSRADRSWTRFHVGRAHIITHQLEPVLERLHAG